MDAKRCRDIRARLGVTQAEFAELLGTTRTTVSRWEASLSAITEPMARLIERVATEPAQTPQQQAARARKRREQAKHAAAARWAKQRT